MRPTPWRACACLYAVVVAALAGTEPIAADFPTLGVEDAVATALRAHPALKSAGHEIAAAEGGLKAAQARANPEIVLAPTLIGDEGRPEAVSISQSLETNGARRARTRIEAAAVQAATAEREILVREIALEVREAYWEAALARVAVGVERQNIEHFGRLAEAAERQVALGDQPRMHKIKADMEVARARQQLSAAEARAALALSCLYGAMGVEPAGPCTLADALVFRGVEAEEAGLVAEALRTRPELTLARARVAQAEAEEAQIRQSRRPDAAVSYWQETFDRPGGVSVSLNLPLVDRGQIRHSQSQAQALVKARREAVAQAEQEVRLQVHQALVALRSAEAQVREFDEKVVAQSAQLAEIASIGYREGALNLLDVLEAQRTLRSVTLERDAALAEHLRARARLESVSGVALREPSPEPVAAPPPAPTVSPAVAPALLPSPALDAPGVVTVRHLTTDDREPSDAALSDAPRTVKLP